MVKKDTKSRREWKIGTAIIIVLFGVTIYFVGWFFYIGSPKEIVSVADQFKPGSDWRLTQEYVEPPRHFCIDVDCPSVSRAWSLPHKLDRQQIEAVARVGTIRLQPTASCFEKNEDNGRTIESCDAVASVNGYHVTLTYSGSDHRNNKPSVSLYIERR